MNLIDMGQKAAAVKYEVQKLSAEQKNEILKAVAEQLKKDTSVILAENAKDIKKGEENGMHPGMIDRLRLTESRIEAMAEGLCQIADLEDPVGKYWRLLAVERNDNTQRVPLGVIGIIYESRPNVTADAFGLCFKTGNAVILKGGSDALSSNMQ